MARPTCSLIRNVPVRFTASVVSHICDEVFYRGHDHHSGAVDEHVHVAEFSKD